MVQFYLYLWAKKHVKIGSTFNCMVSLCIIAVFGFMIPTYCELDFLFCPLHTRSQDTQRKSRLKLFFYKRKSDCSNNAIWSIILDLPLCCFAMGEMAACLHLPCCLCSNTICFKTIIALNVLFPTEICKSTNIYSILFRSLPLDIWVKGSLVIELL